MTDISIIEALDLLQEIQSNLPGVFNEFVDGVCSHPRTIKCGKTPVGNQRYSCVDCGANWATPAGENATIDQVIRCKKLAAVYLSEKPSRADQLRLEEIHEFCLFLLGERDVSTLMERF